MANVLSKDQQLQILRLLVEGNSLRAITRTTGVHRTTIQNLLYRFGNTCHSFLGLSLSNLSIQHVQLDEIWTFCRKKQRKLKGREFEDPTIGDQYFFTALDTDTKLLFSYALGKRTSEMTDAFVADVEKRMIRPPEGTTESQKPQISTDGFQCYAPAIDKAFGKTVKHGMIIKSYTNPESGRYAPPALRKASRYSVQGIRNLYTICTSHVERCNLTIRHFIKRFTRLTLAFSKKQENLWAAVGLHVAYYNFVWRLREKGSKGRLLPSPAMQAGLISTLWTLEDLYENVMEIDRRRKQDERYARLMEKLQSIK